MIKKYFCLYLLIAMSLGISATFANHLAQAQDYVYESTDGQVILTVTQGAKMAYISKVKISSLRNDCTIVLKPGRKEGRLRYPSVNFAIFGWDTASGGVISGSIANSAVPGDGVSEISWEDLSQDSCAVLPRMDLQLKPKKSTNN
ncbi:MAG: hypothetical protein AAGA27_00550 [Pseudomonadota bacterium]